MHRNFLPFTFGTYLCVALLSGQPALAQRESQLTPTAGIGAQEAFGHKVLELARRAGVSEEIQLRMREGLRAWSGGDLQPLLEIEPLLDVERSPSPRLERLRAVFARLKPRGDASATRRSTGRIAGTLTDANTGVPLSLQIVEVFNALGDFVGFGTGGSDGYVVDGLAPGTYFLRTETSSHFDELYDDMPCSLGICNVNDGTPVQVIEGETTDGIDFELTQGGRILGTVTETGSGLPLALEFVDVFNALGDLVDLTLTDGAGNYLFGGLPTGTYYVLTNPVQHFDELYDDIPCPLRACTVTDGTPITVTVGNDVSDVDFVIDAGGQIRGNVSEEITGLPVIIKIVELFNAVGDLVAGAATDIAGNYRIGGLPAGSYFAVTETLGTYFDELYDDLPCPNGSCDPLSGTPIVVTENSETSGIDFVLSTIGPAETPRLSDNAGLIVPVQVDLTDPNGRTTFFAVHNTTNAPLAIDFDYYTATIENGPVRTDRVTLGPAATTSIDVRNDLSGYDTSGLDQLTGLVLVNLRGATTAQFLIGDTFGLDASNDFAAGDRLIRASDFCDRQRIRFVDFGSGTEFKVLLNEPKGAGTPSFSYTAYNESGAMVGSGNFFAEEHFVLVDRSVFASQAFGVLEVDFGNAIGGHVSVTFSAFGRFSVDLGGECIQ